jgi:hypothetical protein
MIKKLFRLFKKKKKKKSLVWLHIHTSQNRGVIGWLAHDRKSFVKGEDTFEYKGKLQRIVR